MRSVGSASDAEIFTYLGLPVVLQMLKYSHNWLLFVLKSRHSYYFQFRLHSDILYVVFFVLQSAHSLDSEGYIVKYSMRFLCLNQHIHSTVY